MKRLTTVFLTVVLFSLGWYFYHIYQTKQQESEKAEAERTAERAMLQASLAKLRQRTNASLEWETELTEGQITHTDPVLKVEIEKLWLTPKPILFIGKLSDIATHDENNYTIEIVYDEVYGGTTFMLAELRLELICNKQIVDSVASNLRATRNTFLAGVAVAGKIEKIERDGHTLRGKGQCVDLIYVSNMRLLPRWKTDGGS